MKRSLLKKIGKSSKRQRCSSCDNLYEIFYLPLIANGIKYRRVPFLRCQKCHINEEINGVMWVIQENKGPSIDFSKSF